MKVVTGILGAACLVALTQGAAGQTNESVVLTAGSPNKGDYPEGDLILGRDGALYGTELTTQAFSGSGVVYRLVPIPGGSQFRYEVLHVFTGRDGAAPRAGLIEGPGGVLYGTTSKGGAYHHGVVFQLVQPVAKGARWTETVLHDFTGGGDGGFPVAPLLLGTHGELFGTAEGAEFGGPPLLSGGAVFEVAPPAQAGDAWTFSVLHLFPLYQTDGYRPTGGLIADKAGNLFGTTFYGGNSKKGNGTVFELSPPVAGQAAWTEQVIHNFGETRGDGTDGAGAPAAALVADAAGNLYGTTQAGGITVSGTIFKLSPPGGSVTTWTETILHDFAKPAVYGGSNPTGTLILDADGSLLGTASMDGPKCPMPNPYLGNSGTAFRLAPPQGGSGAWVLTTLHGFWCEASDGRNPAGALTPDGHGAYYGVTAGGGTPPMSGNTGTGVVFKLSP